MILAGGGYRFHGLRVSLPSHRAVVRRRRSFLGIFRYVAKEDVENAEVEGYYSYPDTHVSVKDLRGEDIVLKTKLCTKRGMTEGFE